MSGVLTLSQRNTPPNAPTNGGISLYSNGDNLKVMNDQGQVTDVLPNSSNVYWEADLVPASATSQSITNNSIKNLSFSGVIGYGGIESYVTYDLGSAYIVLSPGTYDLELFVRIAVGFVYGSVTNTSWFDIFNSRSNQYIWGNSTATYRPLNVSTVLNNYASSPYWNRPYRLVCSVATTLYIRGYCYSTYTPVLEYYVMKEGSFVRIRKIV